VHYFQEEKEEARLAQSIKLTVLKLVKRGGHKSPRGPNFLHLQAGVRVVALCRVMALFVG